MRLLVVAQGKLKDAGLRALVDDYLKRVNRYVRCDEIEVKDALGFERAIPEGATLIALEVDGEASTSSEFSRRLERWLSSGKGLVVFLIGGADGLPEALSRRAHQRISLSRMTLPHRLARLVLAEQLYRGLSLLRGEPYAREN